MKNKINNSLNLLKKIISDYQEEGLLEPWHENDLVQIFEGLYQNDSSYEWKEKLSKKEKKSFVRILKDFGDMDTISCVPKGMALRNGYGAIIRVLLKRFTPAWKRWLVSCLSFCFSCLICGLFTQWLLGRFSIGIYTVFVLRALYWFLEFIPAIYLQNELLIRRLKPIKNKKKVLSEEV